MTPFTRGKPPGPRGPGGFFLDNGREAERDRKTVALFWNRSGHGGDATGDGFQIFTTVLFLSFANSSLSSITNSSWFARFSQCNVYWRGT